MDGAAVLLGTRGKAPRDPLARWRALPGLIQALVAGGSYLGAALVADALVSIPGDVVAFWPSAGVALVALLAAERRRWPWILAGVSAASFAFNAIGGDTLGANAGLIVADLATPVIGALATLAILGERPDLSRGRDLAALIVAAGLAAPAVGATIGALTVTLAYGDEIGATWLTWFAATVMGVLAVAPLALALPSDGSRPQVAERPAETLLVVVLVVAISGMMFGLTDLPAHWVLVGPALWAALRLGPLGGALTLITGGPILLAFTAHGQGLYAVAVDNPRDAVLLAQAALFAYVVMLLALTSVVTERRREAKRLMEREEQLRQVQRMESLGTLAAAIAHDFNNVLGVIEGHGELALKQVERGEDAGEHVRLMLRASAKGGALTRRLRAFSRRQPLRHEHFDLNAVVADMYELLNRTMGGGIDIHLRLDPSVTTVLADPGQVEQIVLNLVVNARDAMPTGGTVTVATRSAEDAVVLEVFDTGVGMDRETLARASEPTFTTKDAGTGLGLATVEAIAAQHGGHMSIESTLGSGTCVRVHLPRPVPERAPIDAPAAAVDPLGTVLLAEDDASLRDLMRSALVADGYRLLAAADGDEALALATGDGDPIDLLVTDVTMPSVSGPELYERLREGRPDLRVLYISGYPDGDGLADIAAGASFLNKPFGLAELTARVRALLDIPAG